MIDNLIEMLERPELNKSGIADLMFPNSKYARTMLNNKLKGNADRKLSDQDIKNAWTVLKKLAKDINKSAPTD